MFHREVQRLRGVWYGVGFTHKNCIFMVKTALQNQLQFMKHKIYTQQGECTDQYFRRKQAEPGLF